MAQPAPAMSQRGQTLVLFALMLPVVLLPVAAYGVEATMLGTRQARLQAVAAQAAEDAAQQLDAGSLRSSDTLQIDPALATQVVIDEVARGEPGAVVDTVAVSGNALTMTAHETVRLQLATFVPGGTITLRAGASARLTPGYDIPSSLRALSTSSF